jgi:D-threo-aldose 1-dehydrogenase
MTDAALPPALGFGAANLGNLYREITDDQASQVLEAAWTAGIRHFDTAPHYGLGLSERRLGEFLRTKPRAEYFLSTKAGRVLRPVANPDRRLDSEGYAVPADFVRDWDPSEAGIRRSVESSLERLGVDRIDLVYLHDPERYDLGSARRDAYPALAQLREEGVVGAIGIGSMSVEALADAAADDLVDTLMIAGRLTLVDPSAERDVLPLAEARGKQVVVASVFNSGLLAKPRPDADARFDYGAASGDAVDRAVAIADVAERYGTDLPTLALHYPRRHPGVCSVIIAGSRPDQVVENVSRVAAVVPPEVWIELDRLNLVTDPGPAPVV